MAVPSTGKNLKKVRKTQIVPFTRAQVYAVVSDVSRYPEFVPFCQDCRLSADAQLTVEEQVWCQEHPDCKICFAMTTVGFKAFNESYLSRIKCYPESRIEAYSNDARLFEVMISVWEFREVEGQPGSCEIVFSADFEFKSVLYSKIAGSFLEYVSGRNLEAFIARLHELYDRGK